MKRANETRTQTRKIRGFPGREGRVNLSKPYCNLSHATSKIRQISFKESKQDRNTRRCYTRCSSAKLSANRRSPTSKPWLPCRTLAPSPFLFQCFLFDRATSVFSERLFNRLRLKKRKKNWVKIWQTFSEVLASLHCFHSSRDTIFLKRYALKLRMLQKPGKVINNGNTLWWTKSKSTTESRDSARVV